jgi:PKD repeat protein
MVMDTALCPYERLRFSVQGLANNQQAEYRLGQASYQPVTPGRHAVSLPAGAEQKLLLIVRTGQNPALADTQAIQVLPRPEAAFTLKRLQPHRYQFSEQSQQAINQQWRLGDGDKQRQAAFSHTYQEGGTKQVQLIASAASGCMDTAVQQFVVEEVPDVELPNIFTPNGDGRNDRLHITHGELNAFELRIKNGQGTVVFESLKPLILTGPGTERLTTAAPHATKGFTVTSYATSILFIAVYNRNPENCCSNAAHSDKPP